MKYVTFSYDDDLALDSRLVEIFDHYGAKCTFNLNSGMPVPGPLVSHFLGPRRILSLGKMREMLADTPHEIACHGKKHQDLLKLSETERRKKVAEDKKILEETFSRKMKGFAYPFGTFSEATTQLLRESGFAYARTTVSSYSFAVPEDFLIWNPTCHHEDERLFELAEQFRMLPADGPDQIFYIWGHAFEFGLNKNWDRLEKLLEILAKDPAIVYATNGQIVETITGDLWQKC